MSQTMSSPELISIEPDTASTDDGEFILAVKGIGFTMHSQVFFNDMGMATGMLGQDLLSAPLNPALYEPGIIDVTVHTGDHETPPVRFTLTEPEEEVELEPQEYADLPADAATLTPNEEDKI